MPWPDCPTDNAAVRAWRPPASCRATCRRSAGHASTSTRRSTWPCCAWPLSFPACACLTAWWPPSWKNAAGPRGRALEVPQLERIGAVLRDRDAELVVAGRVPSSAWAYLETESACRVRCFIEERGMRSRPATPALAAGGVDRAPGRGRSRRSAGRPGRRRDPGQPRADGRAARSADAVGWPAEEERFASDFLEADAIQTAWLAELTSAAAQASVPFLLGGHALVSDGLHILVDSAWLGR